MYLRQQRRRTRRLPSLQIPVRLRCLGQRISLAHLDVDHPLGYDLEKFLGARSTSSPGWRPWRRSRRSTPDQARGRL